VNGGLGQVPVVHGIRGWGSGLGGGERPAVIKQCGLRYLASGSGPLALGHTQNKPAPTLLAEAGAGFER
jgi:hypothetical protein